MAITPLSKNSLGVKGGDLPQIYPAGGAGNFQTHRRFHVRLAKPCSRMSRSINAPVSGVHAAAYRIPTDAPEADGTFAWDATTLIVVHVQAGDRSGLGYTYADASVAALIETLAKKALEGRDCIDIPARRLALQRAVRNFGRSGLAACAISALDAALWDLKAKVFDVAGDAARPLPRRRPDLRQRRLHLLHRRKAQGAAVGLGRARRLPLRQNENRQ